MDDALPLAGRVPWRRLLPAAVLTALLRIGLGLFPAVYFSSEIISDSRLYGTIGVLFALLTWFIAIGAVIVLGAVGGATWDQRNSRSGRTKTGSAAPGQRIRYRRTLPGSCARSATTSSFTYSPPP